MDKNHKITLLEFKKISNQHSTLEPLNEALLLNKGKKYNQLCFVCGGAGSGKNFVLDSVILANKNDYKEISSDKVLESLPKLTTFVQKVTYAIEILDKFFFQEQEGISVSEDFLSIYNSWKSQSIPSVFKNESDFKEFIKKDILDQIEKNEKIVVTSIVSVLKELQPTGFSDVKYSVLRNNPFLKIGSKSITTDEEKELFGKNISFLRLLSNMLVLFDKQILVRGRAATNAFRPNLLVEMIGSKSSIEWYVKHLNYRPEDTHLIWVVSNIDQAYKSNLKRSRNLAKDTLVKSHLSAYNNLITLFNEDSTYIGGEIWIVFNPGKDVPKFVPDKNSDISAKQQFKNFNEFSRKNKDFENDVEYFKIKDVGKEIFSSFTFSGEKKKQFFDLLKKYTGVENTELSN